VRDDLLGSTLRTPQRRGAHHRYERGAHQLRLEYPPRWAAPGSPGKHGRPTWVPPGGAPTDSRVRARRATR